MSRYSRIFAAGGVALAGIISGGVAVAVPASGATRPAPPISWPSYWSSACSVPAQIGFASCDAVQLRSPSQHWRGPRKGPQPVGASPSARSAQTPAPPSSGYYPADLQSAYGLASALQTMSPGAGAPTIAVVDAYDDPNAASDLGAYRAAMSGATSTSTGLTDPVMPPLCSASVTSGCVTFRKINQSGGTSYPSANSGWAQEISLDLDTVSAVCPDCNIVLVEASSSSLSNLGAAVDEAKTFDPAAITNSYGGNESSSESNQNGVYTSGPGTAITVSAGDNGYGVEFPASSPGVTAVGGTSLSPSGGGWSNSAWSGSGSGCSAYEAMPSWQQVAAYSNSSCNGREVADLSADADPNTGVAAYDTYGQSGWLVFGGTSLSAQIIGGIYAVASTQGTYEPSSGSLYVDAGGGTSPTPGLQPVTSGSNASGCTSYLCNAADSLSSGYNGPTGLGSPYGVTAFVKGASGTTTTTTAPTTTTTAPTTTTTAPTTTTTAPTTTTTAPTRGQMSVTVSAGALSRYRWYYAVPVTVTARSSATGAGIGGASAALNVYQGSSCSGSIAASGTFTTGSNGSVTVTFQSRTATTWCIRATVSANGYTTGSGQTTFDT